MKKLLFIGALYVLSQFACSKQAEEVEYIQLDSAQVAIIYELMQQELTLRMEQHDWETHLKALDNIEQGLMYYEQEEYYDAVQEFSQATRFARRVFTHKPALDTVVHTAHHWIGKSYEQIGDEHSANLYKNLETIASNKL